MLVSNSMPGNRTPLPTLKLVLITNVNLKIQLCDSSCTRHENYFFIKYIARINAGTQIMKVAASGETPNISAIRSLTACIN